MLACVLSIAINPVFSAPPSQQDGIHETDQLFFKTKFVPELSNPEENRQRDHGLPWKADLEALFSHKKHGSNSISFPPALVQPSLSGSASPPHQPGLQQFRNDLISKQLHNSGLSTSPEDHRGLRRSSSTLNTFAIPFTRPFQLSYSAASSPPQSQTIKKPSPTGSLIGSEQLSGTWSPSHWIAKASLASHDSRSTISPPKEKAWKGKALEGQSLNPPKMTIKYKNQHLFRDPNPYVLDPNQTARYQAWRNAYAEILLAWEMPIQRTEILKFNKTSLISNNGTEPLVFNVPKIPQLKIPKSLDLVNLCTKCGNLQKGNLGSKCRKCNSPQRPPVCTFCSTYITNLSSPCLNCSHTTHLECRIALSESDIDECVTGCGCKCSEHMTTSIPFPEETEASNPSLHTRKLSDVQGAGLRRSGSWNGREGPDQDDAAYTSLARTLERKRRESRGRGGLRATASQIWRGS